MRNAFSSYQGRHSRTPRALNDHQHIRGFQQPSQVQTAIYKRNKSLVHHLEGRELLNAKNRLPLDTAKIRHLQMSLQKLRKLSPFDQESCFFCFRKKHFDRKTKKKKITNAVIIGRLLA